MTESELNKQLYKKIYTIRMAEEKIREIYPLDVMKTPVHLSIGEESVIAGVCQALTQKDQVYGTYRSHALFIAKEGDMDAFFAELYGKHSGVAKGKAGSMHLSSPESGFMASSAVVASIIPVAVGAAFAVKYKREDCVVAVFFGDGATEEGVFWESLNVSCLKNLPILFVCEDNELAIHAHISDRQAYTIPEAVKPFGIHVYSDKTTDPSEIYTIAQKAVREIRKTGKPFFLHLKYHRYLEHVGINEDYCHGYRCKEDYTEWYGADPVKIQRDKLLAIGISEGEIRSVENAADRSIEESVQKAAEAPFSDTCELFEDIYA